MKKLLSILFDLLIIVCMAGVVFMLTMEYLSEKEEEEVCSEQLAQIAQWNLDIYRYFEYGDNTPLTMLEDVIEYGTAHCEYYSNALLYKLKSNGYQSSKHKVYSFNGGIHVVVEARIGNRDYLFDPTCGLYYPYSLSELVDNPELCEERVIQHSDDYFEVYASEEFFNGIHTVYRETGIPDYLKDLTPYISSINASSETIDVYPAEGLFDNNIDSFFCTQPSEDGVTIEVRFDEVQRIGYIGLWGYSADEVANSELKITYTNQNNEYVEIVPKETDWEAGMYYEVYLQDVVTDTVWLQVKGKGNTLSRFCFRELYFFEEVDDRKYAPSRDLSILPIQRITFPENPDGELTALQVSDCFESIPSDSNVACASICVFEKDSYIFCNYGYMSSLNWKNGKTREIKPINLEKCPVIGYSSSDMVAERSIWNPTGVYYDQNSQKLYVANYHGHNILVGHIENEEEFYVEYMIVADGMISPENVVINKKQSRIAVADYDGNAVFLFDEKGELLWKREVLQAHGIEISEESVYATSLTTREIIQFDYEGNELRRTGILANSGQQAYMWPVALELYEEQLLVVDAHTSRITLLDKDLHYLSAIGSYGPFISNLNFPYCALVVDDGIIVTDTKAERIIKLDLQGKLLQQVKKGELVPFTKENIDYVPVYPDSTAYQYEELTNVPSSFFNPYFSDESVISGFSSIWIEEKEGRKHQIRAMDLAACEYMYRWINTELYTLWGTKVSTENYQYYLFGSPQSNLILYYNLDCRFGGVVKSKNNIKICMFEDELRSSVGDSILIEQTLETIDSISDSFTDLLEKGYSRYDAYVEAAMLAFEGNEEITKERFLKWMEEQCTTAISEGIFQRIVQGQDVSDDLINYHNRAYIGEVPLFSVLENIIIRSLSVKEN